MGLGPSTEIAEGDTIDASTPKPAGGNRRSIQHTNSPTEKQQETQKRTPGKVNPAIRGVFFLTGITSEGFLLKPSGSEPVGSDGDPGMGSEGTDHQVLVANGNPPDLTITLAAGGSCGACA